MTLTLVRIIACLLFWTSLSSFAAAQNADPPKEIAVIDDAGKAVRLEKAARRVIPLYAGLGETLAAMGLTDYVVGRTASDDALPSRLPVVGTHMRPSYELLAALRPDLVLMLEGRDEATLAAEQIVRLGIPVARFRVASFADLFSCIERLGVLTGREANAGALVASLRSRLAAVERKSATLTRKPRVFFEVRYPNLLGAGARSMPSDIIRAAGGSNCLEGYPSRMVRLSEEALVLLDPDIYLMQQGPMNKQPLPPDARAHFRQLRAVRERAVVTVPESRFSRPGPQSVLAAEELVEIFLQHDNKTGGAGSLNCLSFCL